MPRAIPMGYSEQHFDRYVDSVVAFSEKEEVLPVQRVDWTTLESWKCGRASGACSSMKSILRAWSAKSAQLPTPLGFAPAMSACSVIRSSRMLRALKTDLFSMEHLDSSTYYLGFEQGLTAKSTPEQRERVRFNRAHHIAHSWIPKRAYGEGYFPFTWELAPLIDTIWLSEGFARHIVIEALTAGMAESESKAYRQRQLDGFR